MDYVSFIYYFSYMATIKFFLQSKNNPAGIYVRLRDGRTIDAKAKTKYVINPNDWSNVKGQPKNLKEAELKVLNENLNSLANSLLSHFNNSIGRTSINSNWLKEFISPTQDNQTVPNRLLEYFDYYAANKKSTITESTSKKVKVNRNLVERFEKATKTQYLINDVNAAFKLKFEEYCKKDNYSKNTIARAMKFIKTICYHARNNGVETHFQLNDLSLKTEKIDKIFLTPKEIEQIQNCDKITAEHLMNARDWLVISCETGQRVSDFMRFKKRQIRFEGDVPLIEFTQVKTGKIMAIPLSKKVRDILDKRGGEFPRKISDQRYNEYIKTVCKLADIDQKIKGGKLEKVLKRKVSGVFPKYELVTSHIGRRSFATNNYGRIPTSLLINMTGHSTESMFLEYIGKTETEKAVQLAAYF